MMLKLLSTGIVIILTQSVSAHVTVDGVWFRKCTNAQNCSLVTRWQVEQRNRALEVVCRIKNVRADDDDYFVLATTDYIVAPRTTYSAKDFGRLRNEVSWGRIVTQDDDMGAVVVRGLRPGMTRELAIKAISPVSLIAKFSDGSDNLWPWQARVKISVINQKGQLLASGNAILEIEPPRSR